MAPLSAGTDLALGATPIMLIPSRTRLARALAGLVLAAMITSFSSWSFADGGDGALDVLLDAGIERYKRHDYEGARGIFARAHEVNPSEVGILFNLALAELQSGHTVDAANHLRTFVASAQAQPDRRESARSKWLPEAEAKVGRLSIEAPTGTQISIDGAAVGVAPLEQPIYVAPGDHSLSARLASGDRWMHVTAEAGNIVTVRFVPDQAPPAPPASMPSPPPETSVVPEIPAPVTASSGSSPAKVVTVSVLGASALAATGFALAFGVEATNAKSRADALRSGLSPTACAPSQPSVPPACPQLASANSDQNHSFNLQIDFYVTAGALAVVGAATWFLWPQSHSQSAWSIQPAFDGRSASAMFVGAF